MARTAYLEHSGPLAFAHRGFSRDGLENSMSAFAAAVDLGFGYVETDVHATLDGVLLAFHDDSLDRVTDATGRIAELSWSRVRSARIGGREPIPQLDEVLERWPGLRVNIDVKSEAAIEPLVRCIERHRAHERVCIASFSDDRRRRVIAALSRPVVTSAGRGVITRFTLTSLTRIPLLARRILRDVDALQVPLQHNGIPVVTPTFLRMAHRAGTQVHVWTVDEPAEMEKLLDMGVDGLITDRADLLRGVLRSRGEWH
ncbi:glycerophosphodiester phosphodiesterase [Dermacoccaceae bacterium W4C1]